MNNRLLLDTHALIWMRQGDARMPRKKWEPVFASSEIETFVSIVSLWEIAIKRGLGKLTLEGSLDEFSRTIVNEMGFQLLPIDVGHLSRVEKLPLYHRDPFDRLLIAQAIEIGAAAVTDDPSWADYPLKIQW